MPGNPQFGMFIRSMREEKKKRDPAYSLRKFAEAAGISATFMSKVENGEFDPPAPDKIKKMAELLEVNSDELLAMAGKVDPDLSGIIRDQPRAMADFLRTARDLNLGRKEIEALTDKLRAERCLDPSEE
ncbi:transcriptional regulator, XRE family [Magnetococcus marinus MC-1]|uniref:Transcriptional regulator, XRE family n=1 Tax=Magnetococcus marinus (strain ATCC BAA-1437 / JCM 17883 / MC-1) TaxID=156889 RepID=A0LB15_MAGMM|nr:helix-turn-helix transcriptional regulator [Magnetococcus marinus]ABK45158.1 transcriptional regulator, XRE family [Magnetococcus marinus MC-1]